MRMKKIILLVSIACSAVLGVAQQDAMYTHYMFNTLAVNPGYAGSRCTYSHCIASFSVGRV